MPLDEGVACSNCARPGYRIATEMARFATEAGYIAWLDAGCPAVDTSAQPGS